MYPVTYCTYSTGWHCLLFSVLRSTHKIACLIKVNWLGLWILYKRRLVYLINVDICHICYVWLGVMQDNISVDMILLFFFLFSVDRFKKVMVLRRHTVPHFIHINIYIYLFIYLYCIWELIWETGKKREMEEQINHLLGWNWFTDNNFRGVILHKRKMSHPFNHWNCLKSVWSSIQWQAIEKIALFFCLI